MRRKCNGDTKIAYLFCQFFTRGEIKTTTLYMLNGKTQNEMRKIKIAKKKPVNGNGDDGKRGHVGRNTWEGLHKPDISIFIKMISQEHLGHQSSGAPPPFFGVFFLYYEPVCAGNALIKLGNIGDT